MEKKKSTNENEFLIIRKSYIEYWICVFGLCLNQIWKFESNKIFKKFTDQNLF